MYLPFSKDSIDYSLEFNIFVCKHCKREVYLTRRNLKTVNNFIKYHAYERRCKWRPVQL